MIADLVGLTLAPTMFWVYAATALLAVLLALLVAPYFGVYGTRQIEPASEETEHPGGD